MMSIRSIYFTGFIAICFLLGISLYLQFFDNIMPCPLCTLQRFTFGLLAIFFLFGICVATRTIANLFVALLSLFTASLGIFLAGRQIWLQHFPSSNADECGVSLQYMMQALPLKEALQKVFVGSAECTQRGFEFLYLNMAEWALVWFLGFFLLIIYLLYRAMFSKKYDENAVMPCRSPLVSGKTLSS